MDLASGRLRASATSCDKLLRHGVGARRTDKALVTQAEIDAAADTYLHVGIGENIHAGMLAILEAAERVRPKRKDNTRAERARRFRAKRNAVTGAGDRRNGVPGERNAVPCERNGVTGNVPADLLERLLQAANRNVQPAAGEPHAIVSLIEQGCNLDLDVLPAVRHLLADPIQPPLRRWSVPWLGEETRGRPAVASGPSE
jgi:hypothetical protein